MMHVFICPTKPRTARDFVELARRELAFCGGVEIAKQLLHDSFVASRPRSPQEVQQQLSHDIPATLVSKASLAVRSLDVSDPKNAATLTRLWMTLQEIERRHEEWKKEQSDTARKLSEGAQSLLESLPAQILKQFVPEQAVGVD